MSETDYQILRAEQAIDAHSGLYNVLQVVWYKVQVLALSPKIR